MDQAFLFVKPSPVGAQDANGIRRRPEAMILLYFMV
jgi:hypothetical protein